MKLIFKTKQLFFLGALLAVVSFGGASVVHADAACSTDNGLSQVSSLFPAQYCSATGTIPIIINLLLEFVGIFAVFFIIIGGYQMIFSAGNEEGFKKGRQTLMYAVLGLLLAIFAYVIVAVVGKAVTANSSTSFRSAQSMVAFTSVAGN